MEDRFACPKSLSRSLLLGLAVSFVCAAAAMGGEVGDIVGVDFEESAIPNLARLDNVYLGSSRYIYAFLIVKAFAGGAPTESVSAYDLGYNLISPDGSVINHGFYRLEHWEALAPTGHDFPARPGSPGKQLPAAIGYWKLELTKGCMSRGELQIVPNPLGTRGEVTFLDGAGSEIALASEALSQDRKCHGLINRTYYYHQACEIEGAHYVPGQIVARFMPGVIEMEGDTDGTRSIVDLGLRRIADENRLQRVKRLFTSASRSSGMVLSRTGDLVRPLDTWDVYILEFPTGVDLARVLNAVLALPRCVYAEPNGIGEPTAIHVPNDSLASEAWHIYRINMPEAWDIEVGNDSVHVGVADLGVDYDIYDLGAGFGTGYKIAGGWDFADGDPDPGRQFGDDCELCDHGNWMTSTIGAITNNDSGVVGIAGGWGGYADELGPSIFHFKTRKDYGTWSTAWYADAVSNAYPGYGCQVVTVSYSTYPGESYWKPLKEALCNCHDYGVVVVSNFANDDNPTCSLPACFRDDWIVCLQGTNQHPTSPTDPTPEQRVSRDDGYIWGSSWPATSWPIPALSPDVSAPAVSIRIAFSDLIAYGYGEGNSYATQIAGGVIALMLAQKPMMAVCDIEGVLSASCTDIITDAEVPGDTLPGWDKYSGWGRINADSCLMFLTSNNPCTYAIQH